MNDLFENSKICICKYSKYSFRFGWHGVKRNTKLFFIPSMIIY